MFSSREYIFLHLPDDLDFSSTSVKLEDLPSPPVTVPISALAPAIEYRRPTAKKQRFFPVSDFPKSNLICCSSKGLTPPAKNGSLEFRQIDVLLSISFPDKKNGLKRFEVSRCKRPGPAGKLFLAVKDDITKEIPRQYILAIFDFAKKVGCEFVQLSNSSHF